MDEWRQREKSASYRSKTLETKWLFTVGYMRHAFLYLFGLLGLAHAFIWIEQMRIMPFHPVRPMPDFSQWLAVCWVSANKHKSLRAGTKLASPITEMCVISKCMRLPSSPSSSPVLFSLFALYSWNYLIVQGIRAYPSVAHSVSWVNPTFLLPAKCLKSWR